MTENPFEGFIQTRGENNKSTYRHVLTPFFRWLRDKDKLPRFTAADVMDYLESDECGLEKPRSKNKLLTALKLWSKRKLQRLEIPTDESKFKQYILKKEWLEKLRDMKKYKVENRDKRKALTMEEIKNLLDVSMQRDEIVQYLYLYTGLRPSTLLNGLEKNKREENSRTYRVKVYSSKTDSFRTFFVPIRVGELIKKSNEEGWLDIGYEAMRMRVKQYDDVVNIKLTPHVFRHTFQTHMRNEINDLPLVAAIMGHEIDTLRRENESGQSNGGSPTTDNYDSTFEHEIKEAMTKKHYMRNIPTP